jgi:hypothetical protein
MKVMSCTRIASKKLRRQTCQPLFQRFLEPINHFARKIEAVITSINTGYVKTRCVLNLYYFRTLAKLYINNFHFYHIHIP